MIENNYGRLTRIYGKRLLGTLVLQDRLFQRWDWNGTIYYRASRRVTWRWRIRADGSKSRDERRVVRHPWLTPGPYRPSRRPMRRLTIFRKVPGWPMFRVRRDGRGGSWHRREPAF